MERIVTFKDGSSLIFDHGNFDEHCLFVLFPDNSRKPPKDVEYFATSKELSSLVGAKSFYEDFLTIYSKASNIPKVEDIALIRSISAKYFERELVAEKTFAILYCTMIAENNKAYTKLGKRIKRLGLYKLLFENLEVNEAANFMRGMNWKQIDGMCKERGF